MNIVKNSLESRIISQNNAMNIAKNSLGSRITAQNNAMNIVKNSLGSRITAQNNTMNIVKNSLESRITSQSNNANYAINNVKNTLATRITTLEDNQVTVMFVAVKTTGAYIPPGTITFNAAPLNAQKTFDMSTGKFSPKENGLYALFVNAYVDQGIYARIDVKLNGNQVKSFWQRDADGKIRMIDGYVTVALKPGDTVELKNYSQDTIYAGSYTPLTLMVYKLHQNLKIVLDV